MNEVEELKNKLRVKDLSEEMWKNVSNIKDWLFFAIICNDLHKTTNH